MNVANSGFSAWTLALGFLALPVACSDGGGETPADTSESGAEASTEPESASSDGVADDAPPTTDEDSGGTETGTIDEDIVTVPLRIEGFNVPTVETYYGCWEFSFQLDQIGHIVGFSPKIDNAAYVHHFVLTKVAQPSGQTNGYSCFDLSGEMVWTWAPGGGDWMLPPEAGFRIGDAPGGQVTFRLQVHYNNPLQTGGEIDSSGLDLLVSNTLRPNDAGTMVFGDIFGIEIPPGMSDHEHIATCSSSATSSLLSEPMHIFGTAMHAHNIGKILWSDVYRGGEFAYELNRDDPYLFDSQHMNAVDHVIEPGDEIRTHCIYDSTERTGTTLGGPGTLDEMCWNVVTYWPRVANPIDECSSGS